MFVLTDAPKRGQRGLFVKPAALAGSNSHFGPERGCVVSTNRSPPAQNQAVSWLLARRLVFDPAALRQNENCWSASRSSSKNTSRQPLVFQPTGKRSGGSHFSLPSEPESPDVGGYEA